MWKISQFFLWFIPVQTDFWLTVGFILNPLSRSEFLGSFFRITSTFLSFTAEAQPPVQPPHNTACAKIQSVQGRSRWRSGAPYGWGRVLHAHSIQGVPYLFWRREHVFFKSIPAGNYLQLNVSVVFTEVTQPFAAWLCSSSLEANFPAVSFRNAVRAN